MSCNVYEKAFVIRPQVDLVERYPELKHAANGLALKYAFKELVTEADLIRIGQGLWRALDVEEPFAQARQMAGNRILPIVIESDQAAVQQLPWETLYHPEHGFLGRSKGYALSRRIRGNGAESGPLQRGPLRILLFTSLPEDLDAETGRLNVEEEQAQVQEALMPWIAQGLVQLEMPDDGRFTTLERLLKEFDPHLLFLSGHGKFHHQPHSDEAPYGTFLFENADGDGESIRGVKIADALMGSSIRCVVFCACESGKAASDSLNNGLVRQLSRIGIAHVIGMRESLQDRAGILFARHFCDAVARQERIDVALQQARRAISTPLKGNSRPETGSDELEELSLGQWCLPMQLQKAEGALLIDWKFTPQPPAVVSVNQSLQSITLPPRFIGRRKELRRLQQRIDGATLQQLLITGPGGQGKTALAGKLAQHLQTRGYAVFAFSADGRNRWSDFIFELKWQLSKENTERYDRMFDQRESEADRAALLLRLLLRQCQNRVVLYFDKLDSIQRPDTLEIDDDRIRAWISAAQRFVRDGLILLLTSRWQLPGWANKDIWPLETAGYGDFLQMAQQQVLPQDFLRDRRRLRRVYDTLNGNGRGLTYFAAAVQGLVAQQEEAFLESLAKARVEIQTNMAIDHIVAHLKEDERELLQRLLAFDTPVPMEGIFKLALDYTSEPASLLNRLVAVSLVEKQNEIAWRTDQYQCPALVADWMQQQGVAKPDTRLLRLAAEYQTYLLQNERSTLSQAIIVYKALRRAGEKDQADQLALDVIVGQFNRNGFFRTLLDKWLPDICQSGVSQIRGKALRQTGNQHFHLGEYDTALAYLEKSLAIMQEIGDKSGEGVTLNNISKVYSSRGDYTTALEYLKRSLAIAQEIGDKFGEGATLNNISQIYDARGDYATALEYLKRSLEIRKKIGDSPGFCRTLFNIGCIYMQKGELRQAKRIWAKVYRLAKDLGLAQVLEALEGLAEGLGLPGGMEGWERLAWQMEGRPVSLPVRCRL